MNPLRVAVLGGGRSSEHEVSLASAASVRDGLREGGHEPVEIEIGRDGVWRAEGDELSLTPGRGLAGVDVVFPVLHGPFGEDGTVQGLLECLDIPYVGAGVLASALCMDKVLFKDLMADHRIPQVRYAASSGRCGTRRPAARLGCRCSSSRRGSGRASESRGSANPRSSSRPWRAALEHDPLVIVEAAAKGLEVECSVLGNGDPVASQPGEIVLTGGAEWYDYEAKYTPGGMELDGPARVPTRAAASASDSSRLGVPCSRVRGARAGRLLCRGRRGARQRAQHDARVDQTSVFASLFEASGIPYPERIDRLLELAIERHESERAHRHQAAGR